MIGGEIVAIIAKMSNTDRSAGNDGLRQLLPPTIVHSSCAHDEGDHTFAGEQSKQHKICRCFQVLKYIIRSQFHKYQEACYKASLLLLLTLHFTCFRGL